MPQTKKTVAKLDISSVLTKTGRTHAVGRRKTAVARVWIAPGSGKMVINQRPIESYLLQPTLVMIVNQPFAATNTVNQYDVWCRVEGSGLSGQAGAIRHAISRALAVANEEFHPTLRKGGFLTRDSRKVERKKYGRKKARKRFQFSKR